MLRRPGLHLDQNWLFVLGPGQVGEIVLHRVVHPPAHCTDCSVGVVGPS